MPDAVRPGARVRGAPRTLVVVGALSVLVAGASFAAYPAVRPWSDAAGGAAGSAAAFASTSWVVAHLLGMAGFALLPLGAVALWARVAGRRGEAPATAGLVAVVVGVGGVLPYYGAEDFALHVLGRAALRGGVHGLLGLAADVRFGPAIWVFGAGLVLLAAAGVLLAAAAAHAGGLLRWGGPLLGLGLVLYLPQFFAPPGVRVAHGTLVGAGCLLLGAGLLRRPAPV